MPFKAGDKVKHKSNGAMMVVIGIVGDGGEYPPMYQDFINISQCPKGWFICQIEHEGRINFDFAPESALEPQ
jgi:hypothetical protein